MDTNTNAARSVPSVAGSLEQLSDAELLAGTRRLVGRSNVLLAELLAHLAEVETRGIHRTRACSSLYTYCIYELRLSEDEAFRRVTAARLVRRFPTLFDAVASGELHLTGLLMLGPHLTDVNFTEVLARAKHRTKREIAKLVRVLDPLPAVPARIEPLGPAPARLVPRTPSWEEQMQASCPVRELLPGDRPRDWTQGVNDADVNDAGANDAGANSVESANSVEGASSGEGPSSQGSVESEAAPNTPSAPAPERTIRLESEAPAEDATERSAATMSALHGPQRYGVQFTATEEYVRLVEEAKALLSHAVRNATLEDIQLRAMRTFVAALKKQRYGATKASSSPAARRTESAAGAAEETHAEDVTQSEDVRVAAGVGREPHPASHAIRQELVVGTARDSGDLVNHTRQRGRHIPTAVRRAIVERDGERCTYVDTSGQRCAETHLLEFHHRIPYARDGAHTPSNITLRCAAHNALAAEDDFGFELVAAKKSTQHEPFNTPR